MKEKSGCKITNVHDRKSAVFSYVYHHCKDYPYQYCTTCPGFQYDASLL